MFWVGCQGRGNRNLNRNLIHRLRRMIGSLAFNLSRPPPVPLPHGGRRDLTYGERKNLSILRSRSNRQRTAPKGHTIIPACEASILPSPMGKGDRRGTERARTTALIVLPRRWMRFLLNAFRVAVDVDPYGHETGTDASRSFFSRTVLLREKMA